MGQSTSVSYNILHVLDFPARPVIFIACGRQHLWVKLTFNALFVHVCTISVSIITIMCYVVCITCVALVYVSSLHVVCITCVALVYVSSVHVVCITCVALVYVSSVHVVYSISVCIIITHYMIMLHSQDILHIKKQTC